MESTQGSKLYLNDYKLLKLNIYGCSVHAIDLQLVEQETVKRF